MLFNIEIIGYVASIFTIFSLTCENIMNLRILNLIGSSIWIVYGWKKNSNSVILANSVVVFIQLYLIYRLLNGINIDNNKNTGDDGQYNYNISV